jgi:hypothetical protein
MVIVDAVVDQVIIVRDFLRRRLRSIDLSTLSTLSTDNRPGLADNSTFQTAFLHYVRYSADGTVACFYDCAQNQHVVVDLFPSDRKILATQVSGLPAELLRIVFLLI